AWSLTSRAPFTDPAVVEYALALPPTERVGKRHLRAAVRGIVPDAIIDRTDKRGFPVPFVEWAQGPLRDLVGDRIGYVPDPDRPWDRQWWYDLCAAGRAEPVAA
ncbi:MAG: asparagine synthase-related protein, partial [Candidatus Nanopelagicales bacterium]